MIAFSSKFSCLSFLSAGITGQVSPCTVETGPFLLLRLELTCSSISVTLLLQHKASQVDRSNVQVLHFLSDLSEIFLVESRSVQNTSVAAVSSSGGSFPTISLLAALVQDSVMRVVGEFGLDSQRCQALDLP